VKLTRSLVVAVARGYLNPIPRHYDAVLAAPDATYRTVARQFQVTREEVCQYMALLRRPPDDVRNLIEGTGRRWIVQGGWFRGV
jgi:hypothetical protein